MGSDLPLPELEPTTLAPGITIRTTSEPLPPGSEERPLLTAAGGTWLLASQGPHGTILSFPGVVDCLVDPNGRTITCRAAENADAGAVRHAILDHVLPRLLVATGGTVLHASGVVVHGSAVLFSGSSGAGKSTLAARCVAQGHQLLGDDAMLVERVGGAWRATTSYPGLRLWPDSVDLLEAAVDCSPLAADTSKLRIHVLQAPEVVDTSYELASVVLIERRSGPTAGRRLSGTEAFSRLWATAFGWPGTPVDRALLDRVARLADDIPVLSVQYADHAPAEEVLATVDELARGR